MKEILIFATVVLYLAVDNFFFERLYNELTIKRMVKTECLKD